MRVADTMVYSPGADESVTFQVWRRVKLLYLKQVVFFCKVPADRGGFNMAV